MRIPYRIASALLVAAIFVWTASQSSATDPKQDSKAIAEVDAGLGPCTADFVITDDADQPVYAASIRVHIAYGFASLHKFDLTVGTNAEGKARFIGLPEVTKQGLFFRASEGQREGSAFDDPSKTCKAKFSIVLRKK
jgi:hypothetical protein